MGDQDAPAGIASRKLLDHSVEFTEKMYDMTDSQIEAHCMSQFDDKVDKWNHIIYIEFSWKELGYTNEWFQEVCTGIQNKITIRREILLQRIHGSSIGPYDQEDIEYILGCVKDPVDELWINEYYKFDIYSKLDKRMPYIIGVDCATGTGGDNNAITILDPYRLTPVAEFRSKYIGETAYENILMTLIQEHLPRAVLCIERNSMGDGIIDHLMHSPIASNLYHDKYKDLLQEKLKETETVESMLKRHATIKSYTGVYTSNATRDVMFDILSRHVNEYKEKFITHYITEDLAGLVRKKSGKIEAGVGQKSY